MADQHDRDRFKEFTIGNQRYQIGKMTPLIASRVHNWILSGAAKLAQDQPDVPSNGNAPDASIAELSPEERQARADAIVAGTWVMASTLFSEELCEKVQMHCLLQCSQFAPGDNGDAPPVPIISANGRWAVKSLEQDALAVNQLILASLKFNISPFFLAGISNSVLGL